ncbi:hypothetical protein A8C56_22550 [Niabella ginsenosidivorans]|uniref:Uncharacterized protein n=1 Tax=Niabella ginsenosidivorans TaxID=1176587 RepID=A0A1A9I741_9BACT|nr:hypothetical protein A8C56_22550 [Niabella ginsenosidivorans]
MEVTPETVLLDFMTSTWAAKALTGKADQCLCVVAGETPSLLVPKMVSKTAAPVQLVHTSTTA